jgi:hypothetical protein
MDKEVILRYKKATGKSLIDSFIRYKTTDKSVFSKHIFLYEMSKEMERFLMFGDSTYNDKR